MNEIITINDEVLAAKNFKMGDFPIGGMFCKSPNSIKMPDFNTSRKITINCKGNFTDKGLGDLIRAELERCGK